MRALQSPLSRCVSVALLMGVMALLVSACATEESTPTPAPTTAPGTTPDPGSTPDPGPTEPEWDPEEHFSGETIRMVIGVSPGGGFDVYGRLFGQFIPRHVAGNPRVVVQNIPGGAQLTGHRVLWTAEPDGLAWGPIHSRWFQAVALGEDVPDFSVETGSILGSPNMGSSPSYVCADPSEYETWDDILASGETLTSGWLAPGSAGVGGQYVEYFGGPIRMVFGYGGTGEVLAAYDRDEIDVTATCDQARVPRLFPEWIEQNRIVPVFWWDQPPEAEWWMEEFGVDTAQIPHLFDIDLNGHTVPTEADQEAFEINRAIASVGRTFMTSNGTPDHILEYLQEVFKNIMDDPDFYDAAVAAGFEEDFGYGPPSDIRDAVQLAAGLTEEQREFFGYIALGE